MAVEFLEPENYSEQSAPQALTKVQDLYHPQINLPDPDSIPRFDPRIKVSAALKEAAKRLAGESLALGYGYGSDFTGESSEHRPDFIFVVHDEADYYRYAIPRQPKDFGSGSVERNVELNKSGLNYVRTEMEIGGKIHHIKYGVVGLAVFQDHLLGIDKEGNPSVPRGRQEAIAGRFGKAAIASIYEDPESKVLADHAINHARLAGSWLALGMLPDRFTLQDFSEVKINESYHADVRVEKWAKHQIIRRQTPEDYYIMDHMLLKKMEESGIVTQINEDVYESMYRPSTAQVLAWVLEGKINAVGTNFGKNIITGNPLGAFKYGYEKTSRSITDGLQRSAKSLVSLLGGWSSTGS